MPTMSLSGFPNEILLLIGEWLEPESAINAFSQTNHRLHALLINRLYRCNIEKSASSCLLWAAENEREEIVRKALELGADVWTVGENRKAPLHIACSKGHVAVLKLLLAHTSRPADRLNYHFESALHMAVKGEHCEIVRLLLAVDGVDPNADDDGTPPLANALCRGNEKLVAILLDDGRVKLDFTSLCSAAYGGNEVLVNLCLPEYYRCLNKSRRRGHSYGYGGRALCEASKKGHEAIVKLLLGMDGVDPDCRDDYMKTSLTWAARYGHETIVQLLIATGRVDPDTRDYRGRTPCSFAATNKRDAVLKLLLETGVDPDSKDEYGQTPLSWAAMGGREQPMKLLLATGVDPDSKDKDGQTPLSWAAYQGHEIATRLLLAADGVDPDSKDKDGRTSLSWAAYQGHEIATRLLLAADGVDPDSKDKDGRTSLSWAAYQGHEIATRLLLAADGVDPDSKDKDGRTPLSLAEERGHKTVAELLRSRM